MSLKKIRRSLPALLALSALLLALAATGCQRGAKTASSTGSDSRVTTSLAGSRATSDSAIVSAPPVAAGESLAERTMPYAKRKATMPARMPIEIPVIDGSVVSTSAAVSSSSWLYTIETSGTIASVGDWYARAYANAAWRATADAATDDGLQLTFTKHAAQTVLTIRRLEPGTIQVRASIGVGQRAPATN